MTTPAPRQARGLRDRINLISHFDVNVTDAERSREFYERTMPLLATARIEARQDFPSLGITDGELVGYRLENKTQMGAFPAIHLIEWRNPRPVGTPYAHHANVGWYRIVPGVADIHRARERAEEAGARPFQPTSDLRNEMTGPGRPSSPYQVFTAPDPDGVAIEWIYDWRGGQERTDREALDPSRHLAHLRTDVDRLMTVANNTRDVDRNLSFYTDILGLDFFAAMETPRPVPNIYSAGGGETHCDGGLFFTRGDRRFFIDWLQWSETGDLGEAYAEPNHLGIIRCTLEVDDLDECHRILSEATHHGEPVGGLTAPEEWDLGPDLGVRRVVNFTDPDGTGFQLMEQRPTGARLHPWSGPRD